MLDELLGKKELKERIEDLEDEVESLENKLEAENERRKEAVREKQEAQRDINKMESKIHELEDRVQKAEKGRGKRRPEFRKVDEMSPGKTREALELLESMSGKEESFTTAKIEPEGDVPEIVEGESLALLRKIDSETGLVVFTEDTGIVSGCLVPPVPVSMNVDLGEDGKRVVNDQRFVIDRRLFEPAGRYGVAVLRSDAFAGGIYEGEERVNSRFVSSSVRSKHSKGGWSQKRFERIRDEQIQNHLNASAEALEELLGESGRNLKFLGVAGEKRYLDDFAREIEFDGETVTRSIDTHGKEEELMRSGFDNFWSSRLYVF